MAERLQIWNAALGHIGEGSFLTSENEDGSAALNCRRYYALARDAMLAEHPWRFAERTERLAGYGTVPDGWGYAYRAPAAAITIRRVMQDGHSTPIPWALSGITDAELGETTLILTNQILATVLFTRRVENEAIFPPLFAEALAWRLAWAIAVPLSKEPRVRTECWGQYLFWLSKAAAADQNHVYETPPLGALLMARE
jgi:hypothetical protein